jgi:hypothetical protein
VDRGGCTARSRNRNSVFVGMAVSRREDLERFDKWAEEFIKRHPVWAWVLALGISLVLFVVGIGLLELLKFLEG